MAIGELQEDCEAVIPTVLLTNPSPASHPNRLLAEYVAQGIRDSFRIGFDYVNHRTRKAGQNMHSDPGVYT